MDYEGILPGVSELELDYEGILPGVSELEFRHWLHFRAQS